MVADVPAPAVAEPQQQEILNEKPIVGDEVTKEDTAEVERATENSISHDKIEEQLPEETLEPERNGNLEMPKSIVSQDDAEMETTPAQNVPAQQEEEEEEEVQPIVQQNVPTGAAEELPETEEPQTESSDPLASGEWVWRNYFLEHEYFYENK